MRPALRKIQNRPQAATLPVPQRERSPVIGGCIANNGEAKARATCVRIARCVQPHERFRDVVEFLLGKPGAVILHDHAQGVVSVLKTDPHGLAMGSGVVHQVEQLATPSRLACSRPQGWCPPNSWWAPMAMWQLGYSRSGGAVWVVAGERVRCREAWLRIPQRNISLISNTLTTAGGRRIPEAFIESDYVPAWFLTDLAGHSFHEIEYNHGYFEFRLSSEYS